MHRYILEMAYINPPNRPTSYINPPTSKMPDFAARPLTTYLIVRQPAVPVGAQFCALTAQTSNLTTGCTSQLFLRLGGLE
jgi:hypothetical protein